MDKIQADKYDYDTWFDYIRLEEAEAEADSSHCERVRAVYKQAVKSVPPVKEKRLGLRNIFS